MKPYYETELGKLYHGLCEKIMPELETADFILTDPPYGLKFMGKKWDYDVPSVETFKLMLNAVKPGATMFCFAGSRTQHRMAVNIEDAGWILKDCIMWLYGSGFPKATDISKQMDKMGGVERIKGQIRTDGRGASPQKLNNHGEGDTGIGHADGSKQIYQETFSTTPEAKLWNGWKSHGLKPAYEPILVCMKPNEGSYAENALKHGVAGLNIDGGRIEFENTQNPATNPLYRMEAGYKNKQAQDIGSSSYSMKKEGTELLERNINPQGRYPANIILDEKAAAMLDEQSGELKSGAMKKPYKYTNIGHSLGAPAGETKQIHESSQGGASRFFYCAKASKAERNAGLSGDKKKRDDSRSHGQAGTDNPYNRRAQEVFNHHPTVKPLKLIEYLLTLLRTPTGGICFDPFGGSGTTGIACERLNLRWIMIEKELESVKIAKARIENERKQLKLC